MRIILASAFLLTTIVLKAQVNTYIKDLAALKIILQKTPSYKDQIKGDALLSYDSLYQRLASDTTNEPNSYHYFYNLAQLIFPLKDNHLGFYQLPNIENFKTQASIDSFIATKAFLDYPTLKINVDSLKKALIRKPADSVEGIYHYDKFYSVGLFKRNDNECVGVIVDSDIKWWQKGQIAIHLYQYAPGLYKAIYGHPLLKNFILQTNEKYKYQSLVNSYFYGSYSQNIYSKQIGQADHINLPVDAPKFQLKNINENVQYLLIRTFQADISSLKESNNFYNAIKDSLNKANLVFDLRNNEGGAEKEAKKYFELLKDYSQKGHLYVLVNNETISQAEIFILRLKNELKNITVAGQSTKGMLAYGSNYGKHERLPSEKFEIHPTDMEGSAALLQFENMGINPDLSLTDSSNWIYQIVEIINKK